MNEHEQLVDRAARHAHTVVFLGGLDAGKSTLARATAAFALRIGRSVAYIDADVAEKTVGPPFRPSLPIGALPPQPKMIRSASSSVASSTMPSAARLPIRTTVRKSMPGGANSKTRWRRRRA